MAKVNRRYKQLGRKSDTHKGGCKDKLRWDMGSETATSRGDLGDMATTG